MKERDPLLDHPAVVLYRDVFHLCPNPGYRRDIVVTVQNMNHWRRIVDLWKKSKWNPLKISWMLSEYERTAQTRLS